jgi:hypothetical protein
MGKKVKAADFHAAVVEAGSRAEISMEVPFAEGPVREALATRVTRW